MSQLEAKTTEDLIDHNITEVWLQEMADKLVNCTLMPVDSVDPMYKMRRSFLHHACLYIKLREAIRWESGPQVVQHWKFWFPRFTAVGYNNYANEAVHLIANLTAEFPKHIAYIATHNRSVNVSGKSGLAKPVNQLIEHYNL